MEAHFFKQSRRHKHAFPVFFPAAHKTSGRIFALVSQNFFTAFTHGIHGGAAHQAPEHFCQSTYILGNRHPVVVQDNQNIRFGVHAAGVIQGFIRHAGSHCTVTNNRDHLTIVALTLQGNRHAQRRRN